MANRKSARGIVLYTDWLPMIKTLNPDNLKAIILGLYAINEGEEPPPIDDSMTQAILEMWGNSIAENTSKYLDKVARAEQARNERAKKKDTNFNLLIGDDTDDTFR